jgi:hypothetical protein
MTDLNNVFAKGNSLSGYYGVRFGDGSAQKISGSLNYNSFAGKTSGLINATGGTVTISNGRKFHTFTSTITTGTFTITSGGVKNVEIFMIGGGGAAGSDHGAGGGAGGLISNTYTLKSSTNYSITIGAGGAGSSSGAAGSNGSNTTFSGSGFSTLTAIGGGGGGTYGNGAGENGATGGCGGGANVSAANHTAGSGTSGQGYAGGTVPTLIGGGAGTGGGGVGGMADSSTNWPAQAMNSGIGVTYYGSNYGGGGNGYGSTGLDTVNTGGGAQYGGGANGTYSGGGVNITPGVAGTNGTGGGGGGTYNSGASGGSGVLIISYPIFTTPPATLGGVSLLLWLDGNDKSASSMTISSSTLTTWKDKSGNGYEFSNAGYGGSGVVFSNLGPNAISAPFFSYSNALVNNNINTPPRITFPRAYTVFAVANIIGYNNGNNARMLQTTQYYNDGGFVMGVAATSGTSTKFTTVAGPSAWTPGGIYPNGQYPYSDVASTYATASLLSCTNTGDAGAYMIPYFNGTAQDAKNGSNATATGLVIGGSQSSDQGWGGGIGEVIIYSGVLYATQRQQIEGYLAWKWGIQANLPNTHPYYNGAPT